MNKYFYKLSGYSYQIYIILFALCLIALYFLPFKFIQDFIKTPYLGTAVTLFVGLSVYVIYIKQKGDSKKDAAKIVFLEIKSAAAAIIQLNALKKPGQPHIEIPYESQVLKSSNWDKYKHLFIEDFNPEQWDDISNFYHLCKLVDESIVTNNSYFEKNFDEYRVNIQKITSDFVKDTPEDEDSQILQDKIKKFIDLYIEEATPYGPFDPVIRIEKYLPLINTQILLASTGEKLRALAKIKN